MIRTARYLPLIWLLAASAVLPAPVRAAEFDIDAGRVLMRRLQLCGDCGAGLLVTDVRPGMPVRCPDCGHEQTRHANEFLLTQIYQLCRLCLGPLDPHGHAPGETAECPSCHTRQPFSRDAFPDPGLLQGIGYPPGRPPANPRIAIPRPAVRPGSEDPIMPYPLETADSLSGVPLPGLDHSLPAVPRPDPVRTAAAPMPESAPAEPAPREPAPRPGTVQPADVPSVTADLFGGRESSRPERSGYTASGRTAARVGGMPIYTSDIDRIIMPALEALRSQTRPEDKEALAARERMLRKEVLERLIDRELAVQEAAAIGYKPDPAAVRERENELAQTLAGSGMDIRKEAERDAVMAGMRQRYAERPGSASPEAVREFYRQNRDRMLRPRLLALDQLVIFEDRAGRADRRDCRDIALEISRELEQGRPFRELRERYDEFAPASGLPPAEPVLQPEAAYAAGILQSAGDLRQGAVFGPLFLEGMAVFGKVTDSRPAGPLPFEEAEREIRLRLENEAAERNLDAWLQRLRQKADIVVY